MVCYSFLKVVLPLCFFFLINMSYLNAQNIHPTIMNTSAQRDSSSQEVALKLIHLRRAMRDQFQTYAQKDCIERPTHCHEHKAMLDMLTDDHNQMSNSLNESLPYQLDNFAISLKSLNEYISSERQNNEGNSKDILENMSSVFIPSLQSVHSEWSTMLRTISSSMSSPNNSDDDHHYEVSYKNKNKRNNIPAKYQHLQTRSKSSQKTMLPSTRRRSAADKRLKFVQDIFSSTKDLVGDSFNELSEYIGVDTESISSSLANIGAIPDVILTSLSSLWTTEDSEIQKHVENNKIYHTEENEDEEDGSNNLSNIIETINTAMMTGDSLLDGTALPKDDFGFIHDSDNIDINSGDDNMKNTTLPSPFIRNTSSGFELTSIDSIAGIHEGNIAEFKKFVNLHKYAENSSTYSTNALSQKVLSMFPLDAIYDYKYKQEATASKKLTKQSPNSFHSLLSIETGIGMDDGGDDPTPIERLPCGHGKETEATRIEHTCGTRKISKAEYDTAMALPELVPEYPASNPRKPGDDTCEQVDYFMENTFLDKVKYLPNILTPEQIEEMETRGATHSDYLEAVCVVINDRAAKAKENSQDEETTKTDDNENEGEGGSDATWCKRVSNCLFKATCSPIPTVITRTICVCPYGVYGPRCATPAYSKCSVRADKTSQHLHPNGHTEDITPDTSCDISKSTAATPGSQWSKFHNEYRPNFLQLGTHAPCISAQDPSSSSVDVNAKVECEFIQDVYQGVAPMLIPVMNLDGFTWDTNYNFKYDIYRPESGDEEASYDERDSVDAPKPVFALVSEDHIPEILRWNMTVNAFVRPINWNRLSDISQASSFELTNEQLSSIEPSLVSKNVNYASILKTKVTLKDGQTFSPYIPGGRSTWETRILVTGLNAHSYITKGFSWSVEDLEFQPGKPKSQPLSSGATVALVVVGICLLILIIFVIRYIIRKKEEKFFQQVRDVSTQEAQDRAAAAVFRQEE